ncbi:MAG: glycosyltransferase, partial [Nitrososphaera sp.]
MSGDGWGGLEALLYNLLCAQASQADLELSLIVLNEGRFAKLSREAGLRVRLVGESGLGLFALARALNQALEELSPAIIHTHRYKENFLSYLLARRHGAKSVVTLHGYEPPTAISDRLKIWLRDTISFRLAQYVGTRFVAVSDDLRKRYGVSPQRCVVIPNGIPIPRTNRDVDQPSRAGTLEYPVIGWVGRMVPIKGVSILLEAVAEMASNHFQPSLLLVGDGPERLVLEGKVRSLGISERVHFTGYVEDPRPFFSRMHLFALPSLHEGIPLALLEAMAAGIPVVAAAVGGIPEIIGSSEAARLVFSHSATDW